jgi:hypothetical protein
MAESTDQSHGVAQSLSDTPLRSCSTRRTKCWAPLSGAFIEKLPSSFVNAVWTTWPTTAIGSTSQPRSHSSTFAPGTGTVAPRSSHNHCPVKVVAWAAAGSAASTAAMAAIPHAAVLRAARVRRTVALPSR